MTLLNTDLLPTKFYPFSALRQLWSTMGIQEGVVGASDFQVVQRGAGANMSVDIGAGDAWVNGDDATRQGLYHQVNDATINAAVTTAHASLPRVDQVILQMADSSVIGSSDVPTITVLAGTATAGAQATDPTAGSYRSGAAALPNSALRLADITVPAAASSIVTANIRGRRPWAKGAHWFSNNTSGNITHTSTSYVAYNTVLMEFSGAPAKIASRLNVITAAGAISISPFIDGVAVAGAERTNYVGSTLGLAFEHQWQLTPSAGLHQVQIGIKVNTGTWTLLVNAANAWTVHIEEQVRQNAVNG